LKLGTLEKIAGALGIPIARFFEGKKKASPGLDALIELLTDCSQK